MNSIIESLVYYSVKVFGCFIRLLPVNLALFLGKILGICVYYFDSKHRAVVHANLKIAFSSTKSANAIHDLTKDVFKNYGQNFIELLRVPLMTKERMEEYIKMEGQEYIVEALKKGRGVILLVMHFGSWELATQSGNRLGGTYQVFVKPQARFAKLNRLLNSYRKAQGMNLIERGAGTRDFIRSLKNNEIVAMNVDQGGKQGILVPFFNRSASMSVGAVRVAIKMDVPTCFVYMTRVKGPYHHLIIHEPMEFIRKKEKKEEIKLNLLKIVGLMEQKIQKHPAEYMWFYKIWKYSRDRVIVILSDGKAGHLCQSQMLAVQLVKSLEKKDYIVKVATVDITFKSKMAANVLSILSVCIHKYFFKGRLGFLHKFLTKSSYENLISFKADYIISCGSSLASINYFISKDSFAKSVVILKPGILSPHQFDLNVLPEHDVSQVSLDREKKKQNFIFTKGAPNLITSQYIEENMLLLLKRFSHLKKRENFKIGLLIGGDTKHYILNERSVKIVVNQIKEVAEEINADIFVTTSRRTSSKIENMLLRELKKHARCRLLIIANRTNIPEAIGGILGLSDILIVSGDSISMISEAASSGKKTIVFPIQARKTWIKYRYKHEIFIDKLNTQGYILSSDPQGIKQSIYNLNKNKIQIRPLNDQKEILQGIKKIF